LAFRRHLVGGEEDGHPQGRRDSRENFHETKASDEWLDTPAPRGTDKVKPCLEIAPWLIVIFGQRRGGPNPGDDKQNYYVPESIGIASGFLIAALHDADLATPTHTPNPMKFLNEVCECPANEKPMMIVAAANRRRTRPCPSMRRAEPLDAIGS